MSRITTAKQLLRLSCAYPRTAGLPPPKQPPTLSPVAVSPAKDAAVKPSTPGKVFRP